MQHQYHLPVDLPDLLDAFPSTQYPDMRANQREAFETIARVGGSVTLELPTGSGKTAIGYTVLTACSRAGLQPLFYVTPNKTSVGQVRSLHPDMAEVYGRNEYPCLYYPGQNLRADEIPCSFLIDCPHRVDQNTGETYEAGVEPCPYLRAKYRAKRSKIVVCTMAFYLFTQLFSREWEEPAALVIDEAHRLPSVVRGLLSFEITDYHLSRAIRLLQTIGAAAADDLQNFLDTMIRIVRRRPARRPVLLEDSEIRELMEVLFRIDADTLRLAVQDAVASGQIDVEEHRELLTRVELLVYDLSRYLHSFEYSLPTGTRQPLNYTFSYYEVENDGAGRVHNRLVVKAYYVAPLIRRLLSSQLTVAYSATIGDPQVFGFESGIDAPFYSFPSEFPVENTRVFLPKDTPNLAVRRRRRQDVARTLRRIARACRRFNDEGVRCLVVVISENERLRFLRLCREEQVEAVSYGNGRPAREAAERFRSGEGMVLVGTAANYGEGIDLPAQIAPVIFFFRPGYPSPYDPSTRFEERRFGRRRWALWNWRVMIEALQVRGRNVRSAQDLGVTFFISQQFRRFLFTALPVWLQEAYRGDQTFDEGIGEALDVLKS